MFAAPGGCWGGSAGLGGGGMAGSTDCGGGCQNAASGEGQVLLVKQQQVQAASTALPRRACLRLLRWHACASYAPAGPPRGCCAGAA